MPENTCFWAKNRGFPENVGGSTWNHSFSHKLMFFAFFVKKRNHV